jgi:hypothetical protein
MATQYREYEDPITGDKYRDGVRDSKWVVDKALTTTGFDGIENIDWENIEETE